MSNSLLNRLKSKGVNFGLSGEDHAVFDCWNCGRERKLYYNYVKNIGDCKVCGHIFKLTDLNKRFRLRTEDKPAPSIEDIKKRLSSLKSITEEIPKIEEIPSSNWPDCRPVTSEYPDAWNYLTKRGITKSLIKRYHLQWSENGYYSQRIIIPIFGSNAELLGFQARSILPESLGSKYLFSRNFPKSRSLFGVQNFQIRRHIPLVMTEGVFPAILLKGFASFGKSFSQGQLQFLLDTIHPKNKKICIIWDSDAFEGHKPIYEVITMLKNHFDVRALKLPKVADKPGQPDDWWLPELPHKIERAFNYIQTIQEL